MFTFGSGLLAARTEVIMDELVCGVSGLGLACAPYRHGGVSGAQPRLVSSYALKM
jgi:hypothetical protein